MFLFSDSPYRTSITAALLKLQEEGRVRELKEKYWTVKDEKKKCVVSLYNMIVGYTYTYRLTTTTQSYSSMYAYIDT